MSTPPGVVGNFAIANLLPPAFELLKVVGGNALGVGTSRIGVGPEMRNVVEEYEHGFAIRLVAVIEQFAGEDQAGA